MGLGRRDRHVVQRVIADDHTEVDIRSSSPTRNQLGTSFQSGRPAGTLCTAASNARTRTMGGQNSGRTRQARFIKNLQSDIPPPGAAPDNGQIGGYGKMYNCESGIRSDLAAEVAVSRALEFVSGFKDGFHCWK